MSELHVITTIYNPSNYASRYRLYWDFCKRMEDAGVALYTIELAFDDQPFAVTSADNPRHFQLRSSHQIWYKENLINIAISRLPSDWKYVVWSDADAQFVRPDWPEATIDKLQQHPFVQMFSHLIDLGPKGEPLQLKEGFAFCNPPSRALPPETTAAGQYDGAPGLAWAARRDALEAVGGIIDWDIIGRNDAFLAMALADQIKPQHTLMPGSNFAHLLIEWQRRCQKQIGRDVGYVEGTALHYWHGQKKDRGYGLRRRILLESQFDPATDISRNASGLLELTGSKPALRDALIHFFRNRNEDAGLPAEAVAALNKYRRS